MCPQSQTAPPCWWPELGSLSVGRGGQSVLVYEGWEQWSPGSSQGAISSNSLALILLRTSSSSASLGAEIELLVPSEVGLWPPCPVLPGGSYRRGGWSETARSLLVQ